MHAFEANLTKKSSSYKFPELCDSILKSQKDLKIALGHESLSYNGYQSLT